MAVRNLTAARLRELLHYDPITGMFTNRVRRGQAWPAGSIPGTTSKRGYLVLSIDGIIYRAGRLAWLYVYGEMPDEVDHFDTDKSNNAILNLRNATREINNQNHRRARVSSRSGLMGVKPNGKKWQARINTLARGRICLGTFKTKEQAFEAYLDAKRRLHKGCTI